MATLVLGAVGAAVGGSLGGSFIGLSGAVIGRAVGATLGRTIDQSILGGGADAVEYGRLDRLRLTGASEGAVIPRVVGRVRVSGQVIWATRFMENRQTTGGGGGGKGAPKAPTQTQYSYSISFALALSEGEITRVGRVWADGSEISKSSIQMRIYRGTEDQMPDALIEAVEGAGNAPAYRGIAYVVVEDLDLTPFGNRMPQLSFEVVRTARAPGEIPAPMDLIEGVAIIPGTGEYTLATTAVHYDLGRGQKDSANVNTEQGIPDFTVSMNDLTEEFPNLKSVSLIVSWFGDDLRCGSCTIRPKVEQAGSDGKPMRWNVSGVDRTAADIVPKLDGRSVYGGTPCDSSVIEAIRDLNARGLDVTFYPFILMQQLAGNGLPNPWGQGEQPALPWRGRITTDVGPSLYGSTDRTEAAESEVASFFGTTVSGDFSLRNVGNSAAGQQVIMQGPDGDWSYRRFILHYARLCAEAGGVEAFCIGSEMRGLTQIRGAGDTFPAVSELIALAAEVRRILPDAKISYAADWTEYFGYQPADADSLHYHLDPLWSDDNIDFIGIDNYMPMADWREGKDHADVAAKTCLNIDYLHSQIEGGEGFDWFYETSEARNAQRREPITDGAYDEPWVWRYKDIRNWWGNAHHDRIDGVRTDLPTLWEPRLKPIRFTEYGCAAIDKGANEPNSFVDVKSSESRLPRYSNGRRDDAMQMQYLRALLSYWQGPEANVASDRYSGPMLDLGHSFAWAWDARPWPYFPELEEVWSDGVNHQRGHWISGRSGNQPLATVIREICEASGLTQVDVSGVYGVVRGYAMTNMQAARADLQPLMMAYGVEASEREGKLVFSMRALAEEHAIDPEFLVRQDGPVIGWQRAAEAETPKRVIVHHLDAEGDFEVRVADAVVPGITVVPVSEQELPVALTKGEAHGLAERYLTETTVVRDTIEFELPPSRRHEKAGDVIRLDGTTDLWRIDRLEDAGPRKVQAVRTELGLFEPSDAVEDGSGRIRPLGPLPVDVTYLDLPLLTGEEVAHAPYAAVSASPWPGSVAVYSSVEDSNYGLNILIGAPAQVGVTETILSPAMPGLFDEGPELIVRLAAGELESVSVEALLAGANAAAINDGSLQGWEVFQFRTARLISKGVWGLSSRLRGQRGTEWAMASERPIGSQVVFLQSGLPQLELAKGALGLERHYRTGPANLSFDNAAFEYEALTVFGEGLRPYAPVHLTARWNSDGLAVGWIRRSRLGGDGWDVADVPLGEARESYIVRVLRDDGTILSETATSGSAILLGASIPERAQLMAEGATIAVAQISEDVGPGTFATLTIS